MIRWFDGFYAGLAAGVVSASCYLGIDAGSLHAGTVADFFAQVGHAVPALRTAPVGWPIVGAGVAM